jgi:hypothetical protein
MPVFDADEWFDSVKAKLEGVIPEEEIEKARLEVKRGFLRQNDYDRVMNKRKAEYAEKEARLLETERKQNEWWNENKQRVDRMYKFERQYGSLDNAEQVLNAKGRDTGMVRTESGDIITREEYEKALSERTEAIRRQAAEDIQRSTQSVLALQKFLAKRIQSHSREFNEPLDIDALEGYAAQQAASGRQYVNFDAIYDEWVADKRKAATEQAQEDWKKRTREEIERDVASRSSVPYDSGKHGPSSPFFTVQQSQPGSASESEARSAFIQAFMDETK